MANGLSTAANSLTLFNPKGNTKSAVLWWAGCVVSVAFAQAGVIWVAANTNIAATAVTGTAATYSNCLIGNGSVPSCQPLTAATLPAAPTAVAALGVALTGAITTTVAGQMFGRWFDGSIVVLPGGAISLQTSSTGPSTAFFGEFIWEEIPV